MSRQRTFLCLALTCAAARAYASTPSEVCVKAEMMIDAAQLSQDTEERYRLADAAIKMCELPARPEPVDAESIIRIVHALTVSEVGHPELCRPGACEDALKRLA